MKAIILATEKDTSPHARAPALPGCMMPVQNKPVIAWQVMSLQSAGIHAISVVQGYRKETVKAPGITKRFEHADWQNTGPVRAILQAKQWLERSPCIISYGDIFYTPEAITTLARHRGDIALAYDQKAAHAWRGQTLVPLQELENFETTPDGRLAAIGGRPKSLDHIHGVMMGLFKTTPKGWLAIAHVLSTLPEKRVDAMTMTDLLNIMLESRMTAYTVPHTNIWGNSYISTNGELYEREMQRQCR